MSGLSTLLAYEEEDDEEQVEDKVEAHTTETPIQQAVNDHTSDASLKPTSLLSSAASTAPSKSFSALPHEDAEAQNDVRTTDQPTQQQSTDAVPPSTSQSRPSSPLITDPLHRLIARLPPIPTHTLPSNPHTIRTYLTALTPHLSTLAHKHSTAARTRPSSLVDQLIALPAYHNPAILQRILNTRRVDQHAAVEWDEDEDESGRRQRQNWREEDGLEAMKRQAEREQKVKERREEEERKEQSAKVAQESKQRQQSGQREEKRSDAAAVQQDVAAISWRERELRKRRETAMSAVVASSTASTTVDTAPRVGNAALASADAKRLEAMRRAEEINKRLRNV